MDRVFANSEWKSLFPDVLVDVLPAITSDHKSLLLSILKHKWRKVVWHFRFEAYWLNDEECREVVKKEMGVGRGNAVSRLDGAISSLSQCSRALKMWNKNREPANEKVIQEKSEDFSKLQGNERSDNIEKKSKNYKKS